MTLVGKDWDTRHFGFPVARIEAARLSRVELATTLRAAILRGYRMVYWATDDLTPLDSCLMSEFGGRLVDEKTTFVKRLVPGVEQSTATQGFIVEPYPGDTASSALVKLSIAAGEQCRFAVDPLLPREKYVELYTIWIEKSVRGELADGILIARAVNDPTPLGMVTLTGNDKVGQIELIAVDTAARGRGLGLALLNAADRWMIERGCDTARVVTQRHNAAACGVYRKQGYTVEKSENFYHFHLPLAAVNHAA